MRMWMVNPKIMCRKHLLGEHLELHMIVGAVLKGNSIQGYIDNNLIEPKSLLQRHSALVEEMEARGYCHSSPIKTPPDWFLNIDFEIDKQKSLSDLLDRCEECRN